MVNCRYHDAGREVDLIVQADIDADRGEGVVHLRDALDDAAIAVACEVFAETAALQGPGAISRRKRHA